MSATVKHVRAYLISERLSACGLHRLPMVGCNGPAIMTWLHLPSTGMAFLAAITILNEREAS